MQRRNITAKNKFYFKRSCNIYSSVDKKLSFSLILAFLIFSFSSNSLCLTSVSKIVNINNEIDNKNLNLFQALSDQKNIGYDDTDDLDMGFDDSEMMGSNIKLSPDKIDNNSVNSKVENKIEDTKDKASNQKINEQKLKEISNNKIEQSKSTENKHIVNKFNNKENELKLSKDKDQNFKLNKDETGNVIEDFSLKNKIKEKLNSDKKVISERKDNSLVNNYSGVYGEQLSKKESLILNPSSEIGTEQEVINKDYDIEQTKANIPEYDVKLDQDPLNNSSVKLLIVSKPGQNNTSNKPNTSDIIKDIKKNKINNSLSSNIDLKSKETATKLNESPKVSIQELKDNAKVDSNFKKEIFGSSRVSNDDMNDKQMNEKFQTNAKSTGLNEQTQKSKITVTSLNNFASSVQKEKPRINKHVSSKTLETKIKKIEKKKNVVNTSNVNSSIKIPTLSSNNNNTVNNINSINNLSTTHNEAKIVNVNQNVVLEKNILEEHPEEIIGENNFDENIINEEEIEGKKEKINEIEPIKVQEHEVERKLKSNQHHKHKPKTSNINSFSNPVQVNKPAQSQNSNEDKLIPITDFSKKSSISDFKLDNFSSQSNNNDYYYPTNVYYSPKDGNYVSTISDSNFKINKNESSSNSNGDYLKPNYLTPVFSNYQTTTIPLVNPNSNITYDLHKPTLDITHHNSGSKIIYDSSDDRIHASFPNVIETEVYDNRFNNLGTVLQKNKETSIIMNNDQENNYLNSSSDNSNFSLQNLEFNRIMRDNMLKTNMPNEIYKNPEKTNFKNKNIKLNDLSLNSDLKSSSDKINKDTLKILLERKLAALMNKKAQRKFINNYNENNRTKDFQIDFSSNKKIKPNLDLTSEINSYFNKNFKLSLPVKKVNTDQISKTSFSAHNTKYDILKKRIKNASKLSKQGISKLRKDLTGENLKVNILGEEIYKSLQSMQNKNKQLLKSIDSDLNYLEEELLKNIKSTDIDESEKIKNELLNQYSNKLTFGGFNIRANRKLKNNNLIKESFINDIYNSDSSISSHIDPDNILNLNDQIKNDLWNTKGLNFSKEDLNTLLT